MYIEIYRYARDRCGARPRVEAPAVGGGAWRSPWAHSRHKVFAGVAERATRAAAALQADPARPAAPGGALAQLLRLLGDHAALFTATKGGKVLAGSNAQPQLPHGAQRELAHQGP